MSKWALEARLYGYRRKWSVFALDISKQLVASAFTHGLNILQALFFARFLGAVSMESNQCVWYLIGLLCDCMFSTLICAALMESVLRPLLLTRYGIDMGSYADFSHDDVHLAAHVITLSASLACDASPYHILESGADADRRQTDLQIGGEPGASGIGAETRAAKREATLSGAGGSWLSEWALQTGIWCGVVLCVRLLLMVLVALVRHPLYHFLYVSLFSNLNGREQMLEALVAAPLLGNMFQLSILDHVLKK
mmetsp:Transcript_154085/g.493907  ORF Transcript_154085/g.493907 Transcript_154085/m.493907 type:complete len:252 (-) Transcript_154085:126-881(-)